MINTNLILPHVILTFSSFFIGLSIFFFSSKKFEDIKVASYWFSGLLFLAAITGVLLNTSDFTPFHFLSVVTMVTLPLAFYHLTQNNLFKYMSGLFFNFCGLTIAMTGAMEPHRTIGYRLFNKTLGINLDLAENIFIGLIIGVTIIASIFVILVITKRFKLLK
jgi:hypothetical protein